MAVRRLLVRWSLVTMAVRRLLARWSLVMTMAARRLLVRWSLVMTMAAAIPCELMLVGFSLAHVVK